MAVPTLIGVGPSEESSDGSIDLGLPADTPVGALMIQAVCHADNEGLNPSTGWTAFPGFPHTHDAASNAPHSLLAYRFRESMGESNPIVTGNSGRAMAGVIISVDGNIPSNDPINTNGVNDSSAGATSIGSNNLTPLSIGELIIFVAFWWRSGSGNKDFGTYSGTNPTLTEQFDEGMVHSNGSVGVAIATGTAVGTTALGSRTASDGVHAANMTGVLFGVKNTRGSQIRMIV